jgi:uncharacterized protein YdeI (YjbR/CyaY-like superfamily)
MTMTAEADRFPPGRSIPSPRYSVLYRIETAKRAETRARRIDQLVEMLARGETIHPQ